MNNIVCDDAPPLAVTAALLEAAEEDENARLLRIAAANTNQMRLQRLLDDMAEIPVSLPSEDLTQYWLGYAPRPDQYLTDEEYEAAHRRFLGSAEHEILAELHRQTVLWHDRAAIRSRVTPTHCKSEDCLNEFTANPMIDCAKYSYNDKASCLPTPALQGLRKLAHRGKPERQRQFVQAYLHWPVRGLADCLRISIPMARKLRDQEMIAQYCTPLF